MRWLPVLAVGALLALPAAALGNLPASSTKLVVPFKSIGGIRLGESYAAARAAWGPASGGRSMCPEKPLPAPSECLWDAGHRGDADFFAYKDHVVEVVIAVYFSGQADWTSTPLDKYHTAKGIHLGSSYKAVKRAYPGGTATLNGDYLVRGPHGAFTYFAINPGPNGKGAQVGQIGVYKSSPVT
jgi:hypothetical protein